MESPAVPWTDEPTSQASDLIPPPNALSVAQAIASARAAGAAFSLRREGAAPPTSELEPFRTPTNPLFPAVAPHDTQPTLIREALPGELEPYDTQPTPLPSVGPHRSGEGAPDPAVQAPVWQPLPSSGALTEAEVEAVRGSRRTRWLVLIAAVGALGAMGALALWSARSAPPAAEATEGARPRPAEAATTVALDGRSHSTVEFPHRTPDLAIDPARAYRVQVSPKAINSATVYVRLETGSVWSQPRRVTPSSPVNLSGTRTLRLHCQLGEAFRSSSTVDVEVVDQSNGRTQRLTLSPARDCLDLTRTRRLQLSAPQLLHYPGVNSEANSGRVVWISRRGDDFRSGVLTPGGSVVIGDPDLALTLLGDEHLRAEVQLRPRPAQAPR